jgi:biotin/methionine sulfoxide reductase
MRLAPTTSHWGAFSAVTEEGRIVGVEPHPADPDPSPLIGNVASAAHHRSRVARPAIRRGWLRDGPRPSTERGREPFVEVSWDEALDLVAAEIQRVRHHHGNEAIFAGSYGWASAGRFHHAQGQLHRFLNLAGGYTRSVNTYSTGTSSVLLPYIVGSEMVTEMTSWSTIIEHTDLLVAFGGLPGKNVFVTPGGITRHTSRGDLAAAIHRGMEVVTVSPVRADVAAELPATWVPIRPGSDAAFLLAVAHTLIDENLADRCFVDRCCTGYAELEAYLFGRADGTVKDAAWAGPLCERPAEEIRVLARRMAASRTFITVTYSLQRIEHGEQPVWAALAVAALLGQMGLPGGGFGHGYGSMGDVGAPGGDLRPPTFPQGANPVRTFIPVARIVDLLLHPGELFDYDGERYFYPDTRLLYWAGGNPFHHHQDLNRLRVALQRPDTIVVHEPYWTAMARHADIVLPSTIPLERDDIGGGRRDSHLIAMHAAIPPYEDARDDHTVFCALAERLGFAEAFHEGRTPQQWLAHLYERWHTAAAKRGFTLPSFDEFWAAGGVELPPDTRAITPLAAFRNDPEKHRLRTASGRIELASAAIASYDYDDCPGHPAWLEPEAWTEADRFPLHLIANQPRTRLHSQLDVGAVSQTSKIAGREPIWVHPADAAARDIGAGDVVRVFNARGACLAGVVLTEEVRPGVVQLATGAWFDPIDHPEVGPLCVHGNPNVLTADAPTSRLSQGCSGQHAMVEIERWRYELPPVTVTAPPPFASDPRRSGARSAS